MCQQLCIFRRQPLYCTNAMLLDLSVHQLFIKTIISYYYACLNWLIRFFFVIYPSQVILMMNDRIFSPNHYRIALKILKLLEMHKTDWFSSARWFPNNDRDLDNLEYFQKVRLFHHCSMDLRSRKRDMSAKFV